VSRGNGIWLMLAAIGVYVQAWKYRDFGLFCFASVFFMEAVVQLATSPAP